ncbi:lipase 3-like isoform X1 [Neodiprion fabricii]|uniref:lipase 3-like isoform X1 n=2 Tax=Neodiprion fabricii TaxID=2872261 RepID=UPI001ED8D609|nr:lipase 3-like isoform X1 [Neodiprion fabricii]
MSQFNSKHKQVLNAREKQLKITTASSRKRKIMVSGILVLALIAVLLIGNITAWSLIEAENYFDTPKANRFHLDILPEYKIEKHIFHTSVGSANGSREETLLYRIPGGPKSAPKNGKQPMYIQHGILCDADHCAVNQPLIAIAYILVDQSYDVWLGKSNTTITGNIVSSEKLEEERLGSVADYVLEQTEQEELSVLGYLNNTIKIFGIARSDDKKPEENSGISKWFDKIPGVQTAKKWYKKGQNYLTSTYNKIIGGIDYLGRKMDYIADDLCIRQITEKVFNAWGISPTTIARTFKIEDFSRMIGHPDVHLSTPELIEKYGYHSESHEVETEDGYILTVHRITGGAKHPPSPGKPVVILQHGVLSSSADWVIMGPSRSLGYILSDVGYDVWLGNSRGNTYSKAHAKISPSDSKFWEFSWHEMGVYDMPAVIDHVLKVTKMDVLSYVGHSQGTTQLLVMLSEKPEYNSKISSAVTFAPIAYAGNMRSPIVKPFARVSTPLYYLLRLFGVNSFLPTNAFLTEIGRDICESKSILQVVCSNTLFLATGYDMSQVNSTMVPVILGHVPAGASTKQFVHFGQLYNSKKFRQFDYSVSFINDQKYNQAEPPEYNLQNVRIPMAIFYGSNDLLADYKDVERLASELPNVELKHKVSLENFNHIDFLYGVDAPNVVYRHVVKYLHVCKKLGTGGPINRVGINDTHS